MDEVEKRKKIWGYLIASFLILCVIGFTIWSFVLKAQEEKKDRETAFELAGKVEQVRNVYKTGSFNIVYETIFVTVDGQEYEISKELSEHLRQGEWVKVSGKRGEIEILELIP